MGGFNRNGLIGITFQRHFPHVNTVICELNELELNKYQLIKLMKIFKYLKLKRNLEETILTKLNYF